MHNFKKAVAFLLATTVSLSVAGCGGEAFTDNDKFGATAEPNIQTAKTVEKNTDSNVVNDSVATADSSTDEVEATSTAHFVCVGDNIIHDNIYNEALEKGGGESYDFSDCYSHIAKYIENADVALINQESLVTDDYEPSSYPTFATPTALGDELVSLGFNAVSIANNHVLDKGSDGLASSLDYWDGKGVVRSGAYRSEEDKSEIKTMTVNGITFAFLGYTEYTNGYYADGDADVVYLDDEETIQSQIEQADEIADVVVVSCHYGTEISHELNQQQTTLTPKLVEWGADLIVGTQAHAVSTCEYIDKPDGGQAFVYYGLGNFLHTMDSIDAIVGIMGDLDVVKDNATGEITFENVKAIPVVSHYEGEDYYSDWYNCAVYPYSEYTDELLESHYMYSQGFSRDTIEECLSYIPEEFLSIE